MKVLVLAAVVMLAGCGKQDEGAAPMAQPSAPGASAAGKPAGPSWELIRSKDEMTDEPRVSAQLLNSESRDGNVLTVRCAGRKLEVFVTFNEYLGNDSRPVKYRVDQQAPQPDSWSVSAKGTAVFSPESADFARQLLPAKKVLIEAADFRDVAHRAAFEWTAGAQHIGEVLKACNSPLEGLESKIPGLRKKMALEMERWGPKNILTKKQTLAAVAGFTGEINDQMTPEFALAAQQFSDEYMAKCRAGKIRGSNCDTIKILSKMKDEEIPWSVSSVIYEVAPRSIKKEMGDLRISD